MNQVFVYGTLKRDQCRGQMWPRTPTSIAPGWVRGTLFGRHDYPAMTPGDDRVRGELWRFEMSDMDAVMKVLDQIEGCPVLYVRAVVDVFDSDDAGLGQAHAYHYAVDPKGDGFVRVVPVDGLVAWP